MKKYNVTYADRLDKYVSNLESDLSREAIQRMIKAGNILVNGKKEKPSFKVSNGDTLTIEPEEVKEIDLKPQEMPLNIIYEDDDILIINKEKGVSSSSR